MGEDGSVIDREYWDRVNQGENVLNAAKMFEQNNQSEQNVRREPLRVGKLKRDSFLEQIKTSKLNVSDLYPNDQKEDLVRGEIKIGKIKTKELFNNKENDRYNWRNPK